MKIGRVAKDMEEFGEYEVASFYKIEIGNPSFEQNYHGKSYNAVQLSSIFLKEFVKQTEEKSKLEIESAIITVPAYFTEVEKQNTRNAVEMVGIKVIRLINEPTAAAIAYGLTHTDTEKTILVYDLGGGTFDDMFEECDKSWQDVDDVILVGGSTKMKMIGDYIVDMTGKSPLCGLNSDESVAIGTVIQANIELKRRLAVPSGETKQSWFVPNAQQKRICVPGEIMVNDVISHTFSDNFSHSVNESLGSTSG